MMRPLEVLGAADIRGIFRTLPGHMGGDIEGALREVSKTVSAGREIAQFVNDLIWYLRNVLLCMSADDPEDILDASDEDLARFREDTALADKHRLIHIMQKACGAFKPPEDCAPEAYPF